MLIDLPGSASAIGIAARFNLSVARSTGSGERAAPPDWISGIPTSVVSLELQLHLAQVLTAARLAA
ncbi:hypothetical protein C1N71_06895 [Agrococcus sp. SGAir0287]|nr:hypothetical protein C1N71_06895 [Agrococcus sp. SGAir0287]